jgi:hypothetical protein
LLRGYGILEFVEWRSAEIRVEPLAIDRNRLEFRQIGSGGNIVILVAFVALQSTQLHAFRPALQKVRVVVRVLDRYEDDVNVRSVRGLEMGEAKDQFAVPFLINGGTAGGVVYLAMKCSGLQRLSAGLGLDWQKAKCQRQTGERPASLRERPRPVAGDRVSRVGCVAGRLGFGRLRGGAGFPDWRISSANSTTRTPTGQNRGPQCHCGDSWNPENAVQLFDFRALAAIGRRTGVASIMGINFSGFVAWWLWRTIYLSKLPRTEKKLRVAFDWTLDLIFSKDLVQFQEVRAPMIRRSEDASEAS